jgi:hypothetical protein
MKLTLTLLTDLLLAPLASLHHERSMERIPNSQ